MAGAVGFEPTNARVRVWCLTAWRRPNIMVEGDGFEPSKSLTTDLQSAPFGHLGIPPFFCGAQGRNRTTDTRIFSPLLYHLSYLGAWEVGDGIRDVGFKCCC
jgi:hypothetical protein